MSAATLRPDRAALLTLTVAAVADTGSVPPSEPWMERLTDETRELLQYAHISHTKQVAMDWRRDAFLPPRL